MQTEKAATLARESQWSRRAGVAAILGALLAMVGFVVLQATVGGGANFEGLEEAHDSASKIWLAGISSGVGYLLLIGPLYLLFKAAQARSERVRAQLVGVVILGPLLLGLSGFVLAAGTQEAADEYVKGTAESTLTVKEANKECNEERDDKGAESFARDYEDPPIPNCRSQKREEDKASNAIKHASVITVGSFAGLAGGLALVVALFYTGLWSMRTGLLSRFWGSLGMAVGVAALIGLTPLSLLWFLYLGVFLLGVIPNGKPPAWAAGEAIPWPTPGERAAESLAPAEGGLPEGDADLGDGDGDPDAPSDGEPGPSADGSAGPRRKRKQRGD